MTPQERQRLERIRRGLVEPIRKPEPITIMIFAEGVERTPRKYEYGRDGKYHRTDC